MELTFYTDERILFVPPQTTKRIPAYADIARKQRPAVWVSRFPVDLIQATYAPAFARPLQVFDLGEYRVVVSDEIETMRRTAHLLENDPRR